MKNEKFITKFKVPEVAYNYIHEIFTEQEIMFVEKIELKEFNDFEIADIIIDNPQQFIEKAYRRGIISYVNEEKKTFQISNFYNRLDIFSISQNDLYRSFGEEAIKALDAWYFNSYYESLDQNILIRPTKDEILPLHRVLDFINQQNRPVYLNHCDCRSLGGACHKPTKTCITYRNGINSFVDRGLSEEIDKEKAKEIVIKANKAGLMHTINPDGICNCCNDCCYLFRSQEKRQSTGFWPKTETIVTLDEDACIGCGKCLKQCNFEVLEVTNNRKVKISQIKECIGCGICVDSCPKQALQLQVR